MTCTDKDLQALKDEIALDPEGALEKDIAAAIARLEAAEACIASADDDHMGTISGVQYEAWRKAAGI